MANLLKLSEVAHRLDVSEKTVRRYVKAGELPSAFIGNAYRVREEDIEEYLRRAQVEIGTTTPKAVGRSSTNPPDLQAVEERRTTLEDRRLISSLHPFVSILECDTERWKQAVESNSVTIGQVEEATAHQADTAMALEHLVEAVDREQWAPAERALFRRVVLEEAWPAWSEAGNELLRSLVETYSGTELADLRRRRSEAQEALSNTEEALDRRTRAASQ